jgi:hypothetical protein
MLANCGKKNRDDTNASGEHNNNVNLFSLEEFRGCGEVFASLHHWQDLVRHEDPGFGRCTGSRPYNMIVSAEGSCGR